MNQPIANLQAERAALGAVLINPGALYDIGECQPEDFHDRRHQTIYRAMLDMQREGLDIDFVSLAARLSSRPMVDRGSAMGDFDVYLSELITGAVTFANAGAYARLVREDAERRRVLGLASKAAAACHQRGDMGELARIGQMIADGGRAAGNPARTAREVAGALFSRVTEWQAGALRGHEGGIPPLDGLVKGFKGGELSIVFGYAKEGKSTLVFQMLDHAARKGTRGLIISEMDAEVIALRLCCARAGVKAEDAMTAGALGEDELGRLSDAAALFSDLPLTIVTTGGLTLAEVGAETVRAGAEWVALDHVALLSDPREKGENDAGWFTRMYYGARAIAKRTGAHVSVIAHQNKTSEDARDKRPTARSLQQADARAADVVLAVYRPSLHEDRPGEEDEKSWKLRAVVRVLANRNGHTGDIDLAFDGDFTRFAPAVVTNYTMEY